MVKNGHTMEHSYSFHYLWWKKNKKNIDIADQAVQPNATDALICKHVIKTRMQNPFDGELKSN